MRNKKAKALRKISKERATAPNGYKQTFYQKTISYETDEGKKSTVVNVPSGFRHTPGSWKSLYKFLKKAYVKDFSG